MPDAHALWRTLRAATLVPSASAPADAATCAPHLSPPTPQTPSSGQPAQRCRGARCGGGRAGAGGGAGRLCRQNRLCLASRQRQLQTARNCASCNLPPPDRNKLPNPCQLPSQPCWLQARTVPPPTPTPPHPTPPPHRLLASCCSAAPAPGVAGVKEPGRPSHASRATATRSGCTSSSVPSAPPGGWEGRGGGQQRLS